MRDSRNSQRIGSSGLLLPKRMFSPQESKGVSSIAASSVCSRGDGGNGSESFMRFCFFCDILRSDDGMAQCIDVRPLANRLPFQLLSSSAPYGDENITPRWLENDHGTFSSHCISPVLTSYLPYPSHNTKEGP